MIVSNATIPTSNGAMIDTLTSFCGELSCCEFKLWRDQRSILLKCTSVLVQYNKIIIIMSQCIDYLPDLCYVVRKIRYLPARD